jgi:hypothetical protein
LFNLMFVPCIIKHSRNNQHNAHICTTALFYMLAATCFGSSLPSSGSFQDPSELLENTDRYGGLSYNLAKWPVCQSVVRDSAGKHNRLNHDTPTNRPLNHMK